LRGRLQHHQDDPWQRRFAPNESYP
jgi:hypothetical protein